MISRQNPHHGCCPFDLTASSIKEITLFKDNTVVQTIRYGLIGAGTMGQEHLRNLALISGSRVTAMADPHEASLHTALKHTRDVPQCFASTEAMLASGLCDALIVASPNDQHFGLMSKLFRDGPALPLLVEKPVCTTGADCLALDELARHYAAPVWVGMEYRYMPPVQAVRAELAAGAAGDVRMIAMREHRFPFLVKVDDWNRFARRTGGTLVEKCCHFFDLMRLIAGADAVRVYASGGADVNHRTEIYDGMVPDIIDNAFVIIDFANGRRAALDLCMFAQGSGWQEEFAVTGSEGKVECFVPPDENFSTAGAGRKAEIVVSPREPQGPRRREIEVDAAVLKAGHHHGATYFQHLGFRKTVLEGAPVEVSLTDGLKAVVIGLAAELSLRESRAVAIDGLKFG